MNKPRLLQPNEIGVRVKKENKDTVTLVLYVTARAAMNILDETFGADNWQRQHETIDGKLFCSVGVRTENGDWIWRQDVGTESYTEKEKGQATDSFKRACVNFGIGRELRTSPKIYFPKNCINYYTNDNGVSKIADTFVVDDINYDDDGAIETVVIRAKKTNSFKVFGEEAKPEETFEALSVEYYAKSKSGRGAIREDQISLIQKEEERTGKKVKLEDLKVESLSDLTEAKAIAILKKLKKLSDKAE